MVKITVCTINYVFIIFHIIKFIYNQSRKNITAHSELVSIYVASRQIALPTLKLIGLKYPPHVY